jgi:uncharacterized phosphosugar-binding protein
VIAVTFVEQSSRTNPAQSSEASCSTRRTSSSTSTPHADALVSIDGLDTPVGPGSTLAAVAIVNAIKVRTAQTLVERGAMPAVITRASVVGADRSRQLFDDAYGEHARRIAHAISGEG